MHNICDIVMLIFDSMILKTLFLLLCILNFSSCEFKVKDKTEIKIQPKKIIHVDTIYENFKRTFPSILIGEQEWMIEDLEIKEFLNGDPIKRVFSEDEWKQYGLQKKPCYLVKRNIYYYNGHALMDKRGIVPKEYKVPSIKDWDILKQQMGGQTEASKALANYSWSEKTNDSTIVHKGENSHGFNAGPNGYILSDGGINNGTCSFWWANKSYDSDIPKKLSVFSIGYCSIDVSEMSFVDPSFGANLRCIKK